MIGPPEKQSNYKHALLRGLDAVRFRDSQSLASLGAVKTGSGCYELPVLEDRFLVNLNKGVVSLAGHRAEDSIPIEWQILALHYLSAQPPFREFSRWISFGDILEARGYESVYRVRVLDRLCTTAGRERETFVQASMRLHAQRFKWGDQGFQYQVFPLLPVAVAWYEGDDELPPNASFVYPDNVISFLSVEDIVVLSERVVGRLQRAGW